MWVKFTTIEKTKVILILYSTHINYCFLHSTQQKNKNTDSVHYLLYCIAQSSTKKKGKKKSVPNWRNDSGTVFHICHVVAALASVEPEP